LNDLILAYSDTHLKSTSSFLPFNQIADNGLTGELNNTIKGFHFVANKIRELSPKVVIFCGDLYDIPESLSTEVIHAGSISLKLISDACKDVGARHILFPGQHDILSEYHKIYTISNLIGYGEIITETSILPEFNIGIVPYTSSSGKAHHDLMDVQLSADVVFTHLDFAKCRYENNHISESSLSSENITKPLISGDNHCFSSDTEILTYDGWKFFNELNNKSKVMTLNIEKNKLEYNKINNFIEKYVDEDLINIKSTYCDILVTNNHRLVGQKRRNNGVYRQEEGFQFFQAGDFFGGRFYLPICGCLDFYSYFEESDNFLRLLVWIVSDGYIQKKGIGFRFKKERKIKRLKKLLNFLRIKYSCKKQKDEVVQFRLSAKDQYIKKIIKIFPDNESKILPESLRYLKSEKKKIIIDEYQHTDGHQYSDISLRISTSKEKEADLIQELCITVGYSCIINEQKFENKKWNNNYILQICKDKLCVGLEYKRNFHKQKYKGKVYCLTVKNGTLLTRRNGKVTITGNCAQDVGNVHYIGSLVRGKFYRYDLNDIGGVLTYNMGTKEIKRYPNTYSKHFVKVVDLSLVKNFNSEKVVLQILSEYGREELEKEFKDYEFFNIKVKEEEKEKIYENFQIGEPKDILRNFIEENNPKALLIFDEIMKGK